LYYTTYAVVLYKGMPLVHHILLKIRNIMGPAEILLCVLLHFTRIRSFEVGVHSKQDASKKYREGAKEIDEIFYNSPLVVIMITSIKFHKVD
jgi:hypothetical protein